MHELQFFINALSLLLMLITFSSVNIERLKDGNVELCEMFLDTRINIYIRK